MDIRTFCENIKNCLIGVLDSGVDVRVEKISKNNGVDLYSIVIKCSEEYCVPNIYMEEYFEKYQSGEMGFEEIVSEILSRRKVLENKIIKPVHDFSWENIKDKVFCRVINLHMNEDKLKTMPFREYLDLAVTIRILHENNSEGIASSELSYREYEQLGITEDELFAQAEKNTEKLFPVKFSSMASVIENIMQKNTGLYMTEDEMEIPEITEQPKMYVLSNKAGINGATAIIYHNVLKNISLQLGAESMYILPSSIHESIILPEMEFDVEILKEMVEEANRTVVSQMELLSYHVYKYSRNTDSVEIAA